MGRGREKTIFFSPSEALAKGFIHGIKDSCVTFSSATGTNGLAEMSNSKGGKNPVIADEDYEIVCLCQKGDVDAFGSLVDKYQKKMVNIAFRITGDYEAACEVVQDAFVSAYRAIRKFKGEARFSTWLYRIVINGSRNRLKQLRTRIRREGISIERSRDAEDGRGIDPPDPGPSVLEQVEKREVEARVQTCISSLEDEYREVLVLRDIQGFSYDEISDILKIPDGTVKSRLFRAREALKEGLKEVLGER
jgi:RNA polymerase sigma-70 factor (ECF subfamily)